MKGQGVLTVFATAALGFALLPGSAVSQQKSLKDQLVGAWSLVSWERTAPDGTKSHAYGTNPKGVAYYGPDGRFFVLFTHSDLPKVAAGDRAKATADEAKVLVAGAIGYSGTYTVDEAGKTINLRIEVTTFPNQAANQKRTITSLSADELRFTNPLPSAGGRIDVTMKRAPSAATN